VVSDVIASIEHLLCNRWESLEPGANGKDGYGR